MASFEDDIEQEVARERQAKMTAFINRLIDALPDPTNSDPEVADLCTYLVRPPIVILSVRF